MSELDPLGAGAGPAVSGSSDHLRQISMVALALHRVLEFTGHSIDEVINDPIVRNEVVGYYKLYRYVERRCEAVDLERWWNPGRISL